MNALPDKPTGSVMHEAVGPDGVTLSWLNPNPSPGPARFGMAAYLAIFLCMWVVGCVKGVVGQLARRRECAHGFLSWPLYAWGRIGHVAALDDAPAALSRVNSVGGRGAPLQSWPQSGLVGQRPVRAWPSWPNRKSVNSCWSGSGTDSDCASTGGPIVWRLERGCGNPSVSGFLRSCSAGTSRNRHGCPADASDAYPLPAGR